MRSLRAVSRPSLLALRRGAAGGRCPACITYAILTGLTPYTPTRTAWSCLLLVNLTLVLTLGALIAWRLVRLWADAASGRAGARLHVRLVAMFSAIAVVPAILVAIFAAVTLNLGIEAWFSAACRRARQRGQRRRAHYVQEHERPHRHRRRAKSPTASSTIRTCSTPTSNVQLGR